MNLAAIDMPAPPSALFLPTLDFYEALYERFEYGQLYPAPHSQP